MQQLEMPFEFTTNYHESFKKLYYHLYSNSSISRAERIISDISKLLLIAITKRDKNNNTIIKSFLESSDKANDSIFNIILSEYKGLFDESDKFLIDDFSLKMGLKSIYNLDLINAPSHLLGDAFQALIGPNLRGDKGQFFTPKTVVKSMIQILDPEENSKVVDPACGTGGFLTETSAYWERNNKKQGCLIGIEKDRDLYILSTALLRIINSNHNVTYNLNSLDFEQFKNYEKIFSPLQADYVITNPPFGSKIQINIQNILEQYQLGFNWNYSKTENRWYKTNQLRIAQDPQVLFIELCVKLLKNNGKMGIVLPEGVFGNTNAGYIWDYLRSCGNIIGLLDCPRTTFQPGTDTKTNILFFEKKTKPTEFEPTIAVAINCGHDRRGRVVSINGEKHPNDFEKISDEWNSDKHEYCFKTKIFNPYYLVPRYYDRKTDFLLNQDAKDLNAKIITFKEMIRKGWISIKKGHEVGSDTYGTGCIPFVRTSDISNFEISIDPTKSLSEEVYQKYSKDQNLQPGNILMVVDGRYRIGRCAILNEYNYKCIAQSHLRIITVNELKAPFSPYELLYLLSLKSVQRDIRSLVFIQSTLGSIGSRIKEIKIPLPEKRSSDFSKKVDNFEKSINERARLLSSLIELDNQTIEL